MGAGVEVGRAMVSCFLLIVLLGLTSGCFGPLANLPPQAFIRASPTQGDTPLIVSFDGSASFDPDGQLASFQWDFNSDGIPDATGPKATATFKKSGHFAIVLTVTDNAGARDSATVNISTKALGPKVIVGEAISPPDVELPGGVVKLSIENMPHGLQAIEVSAASGKFLTFDPKVVKAVSIQSVAPFQLDALRIDNTQGRVSFIARVTDSSSFPVDGEILRIRIESVGVRGATTPLKLEIANLVDGMGKSIVGFAVIPGSARIK